MIVMLFGHPVPGVAENERSIADVLGLSTAIEVAAQSRNRCGETLRPKLLGVFDDPVRQRFLLELGSDFRHPDRVEFRMDRRLPVRRGLSFARSRTHFPAGGPVDARRDSVRASARASTGRSPRKGHAILVSSAANRICQQPPTFIRWRPSRIMARFFSRTGR